MKGENFNNNENSYEELNDNVNINDYRNDGRIQIMFGRMWKRKIEQNTIKVHMTK